MNARPSADHSSLVWVAAFACSRTARSRRMLKMPAEPVIPHPPASRSCPPRARVTRGRAGNACLMAAACGRPPDRRTAIAQGRWAKGRAWAGRVGRLPG